MGPPQTEGVDDEEVSEEPVDEDWFARWRDGAQDVGKEEMQRLWAKVLGGEVKSPGTYFLNALSTLRNLGEREAQQLAVLGELQIDWFIYKADRDYLSSVGLGPGPVYDLQGLNLLTAVDNIGGLLRDWTFQPHPEIDGKFACILHRPPRGLLLIRDDEKKLNLPVFKLTPVALDLLTLQNFDLREDYLIFVARFFQKNKGLSQLISPCGA